MAPTRMPRERRRSTAAGAPIEPVRSKKTIFVSMVVGSSEMPGRVPFGQSLRVGMVVGEPLDVMAERVHSTCGNDPCLAHGPAHLLLAAPRLRDELTRARDGRTHRRSQALGEIDPG